MIRNGLVYTPNVYCNQKVYTYRSMLHRFFVDGIEYVVDRDRYNDRPMIEIFDDLGGGGESVQIVSRPPLTEAELDEWTNDEELAQ